MTNGWVDMKNTDMMLVMGGNPAENHPCGFKWAIEAKRNRNAKLIVVDPRYTRTAAVSDMFLQIRAGTDIALLGAFINYALQNERVNHEYLVNYTNAAFIVKEGFKLPDDGLYSGWNPDTHSLRQEHVELRSRWEPGSETSPEPLVPRTLRRLRSPRRPMPWRILLNRHRRSMVCQAGAQLSRLCLPMLRTTLPCSTHGAYINF